MLLLASIIILLCVFLDNISDRIGIPVLLAFIALGMLFGSDSIVRISFENYEMAENICEVALIIIMFYGGFGTNWKSARPVAGRAMLMSFGGVIVTALVTGLCCRMILRLSYQESFLIGAILGSTDAASVFSILRSKKLNLKYRTASLLEMESGSNDPCAYMMTMLFIALSNGNASVGNMTALLIGQLFWGILCGSLFAKIAVYLMRRHPFSTDGFDVIFVVGMALLSYACPTLLGGNGYLSVYIVGLLLGNSDIKNKKSLVHFFDGMTGLTQILIFFLLGLLAFLSKLPKVILPAVVIFMILTFVARPLAVFLLLRPIKGRVAQNLLVSWAGLRGASSIVFAMMAMQATDTGFDIYHIVFLVVIFSILLQGTLLPKVAERLDMVDAKEDVMKTFNDYSEELAIGFIEFEIDPDSNWCNRKISDMLLPPSVLIVLIRRGEQNIVPNGSTVLCAKDRLILSALGPNNHDVFLTEKRIAPDSELIGKRLFEVKNEEGDLVIMIQRDGKTIIPNGNVRLRAHDLLVLHRPTS